MLVTGGAGFIGSHTVDALLERGYRVRILDNLQPRVHPLGKPPWVPLEAEFIQGDVAITRSFRARSMASTASCIWPHTRIICPTSALRAYQCRERALLFELMVSNRRRFPARKIVFASSQSVCGEGRYFCANENESADAMSFACARRFRLADRKFSRSARIRESCGRARDRWSSCSAAIGR